MKLFYSIDKSLEESWKSKFNDFVKIFNSCKELNLVHSDGNLSKSEGFYVHFTTSSNQIEYLKSDASGITFIIGNNGTISKLVSYQNDSYYQTEFNLESPVGIEKVLSISKNFISKASGLNTLEVDDKKIEELIAQTLEKNSLKYTREREYLVITYLFVTLALFVVGTTIVLSIKYSRTKTVMHIKINKGARPNSKDNSTSTEINKKRKLRMAIWTFLVGLMGILGAIAEIKGQFFQ
ncbi:MAG: hypothetical protein AAF693_22560 [Bacteroidota bacterium]